jgi:hypothetical protein
MCRQLWYGNLKVGGQLGTPGRRFEGNIKMDLKKIQWGGDVGLFVFPHDMKNDGFLSTR